MHWQNDEETMHRLLQASMSRVMTSQQSMLTVNEMLARSHRSIEQSLQRIMESQRLIRDPFDRPWLKRRRAENSPELAEEGDVQV